jgi:glyoxylase-like metal-dependent hydrolase (beta-lactamase superfamily II)
MAVPFVRDMEVAYGRPVRVSPLIRRVLARNGGPFTFHGTGTYIVGHGRVAVIDAGPLDDEHVAAILAAARGETITHQFVTHTHADHSPASARLRDLTGAPIHAFAGPPATAGRDVAMEEAIDTGFQPDRALADGDVVAGEGWTIEAVHTPGHMANHLCFGLREEAALFSGDHVMGWSTTVIAPPEGDMAAYMASLAHLLERDDRVLWPTHGPPVTDPKPFVRALIEHRRGRESQILACLAQGPRTIPEMVAVMYADVDPGLHAAAGYSVLAHLVDLVRRGVVACEGDVGLAKRYRLAP